MVRRRRRSLLSGAEEEDPTSGVSNLVDAMLVLAVGFLIFVVMVHIIRIKGKGRILGRGFWGMSQ